MADSLQALRDELLVNAGPVRYNLGCGQNAQEDGFTGVDFYAEGEGIVKADLFSYPWPFADESVDLFRSSHFLEHVPDWDAHFREIYRCLKPGGSYDACGPYYLSARAHQDPDHKQPLLLERFAYLSQEWRRRQKLEHYGAVVNFAIVGWFELLNEDFRDQGYDESFLNFHKRHSFNVIDDCAVVLRKEPLLPQGEKHA